MIGQCCNFLGINSTVEKDEILFYFSRLRHLVNNVAIHIHTHYIRKDITVLYLHQFHCINCRFNGLTWNYFFSRWKECFHYSPTWQLPTAYVILSIMLQYTSMHIITLEWGQLYCIWNFYGIHWRFNDRKYPFTGSANVSPVNPISHHQISKWCIEIFK